MILPTKMPRLGIYRCRAIDKRTNEVIEEVFVRARSANDARKQARRRFPNYARIVCEYEGG